MGTFIELIYTTANTVVFGGLTTREGPSPRSLDYGSVSETPDDRVLMFDLTWTNGDLSLELISPNGETYSSSTHPSTVEYMKEPNHITYVISSPTDGNWSANIIPATTSGDTFGYNLSSYIMDLGITSTPNVRPLVGETYPPADTNADGLYDDVNGNGRPDFADVVLYFNQLGWIAGNEPVAAFDYNGNGRIDFADVVWLFNNL